LWTAALVANVGLWMQSVGAAWLMTSLSSSPMAVASVQAAMTGPMVLLALFAGALADVVDGRRVLLWTQIWLLATLVALGVLTLVGATTPWTLLGLTFLFGVGVAMSTPAWQSVTLEAVPAVDVPAAVTLNGVGTNLARSIGPTVGGLVVAAAGPGPMFLLNALAFVATSALLLRWRRAPRRTALPPEHVLQAMQVGVRFVRYDPALCAALVRTAIFVFFGSALWALLPLVARGELGLDALGYGGLLGALGVGAVVGALILPALRRRASIERLVAGSTIVFAAAMLALAYLRAPLVLGAVLVPGGMAWLLLLSVHIVAALATVPAWVRARATAVVLLVFFGGMTVGSVAWGAVAQVVGIPTALTWAALALVLSLGARLRYRLADEAPDLTATHHWAEPHLVREPPPDRGPVLVMVEYRIDPEQGRELALAMHDVRLDRLRNGATSWNLFTDPADPGRYVEVMTISSWEEHQRAHARVTQADSVAEARAKAFHVGPGPTVSTHLVGEPLPDR
jgi:MFS family permease